MPSLIEIGFIIAIIIIAMISAYYAVSLDQFYAKIFTFTSITAFVLAAITIAELLIVKKPGGLLWFVVAPLSILVITWFGIMGSKYTEYQEEMPWIYGCTASLTNVSATDADINLNINIWNERSTEIAIYNISYLVYYQWWEGGEQMEIEQEVDVVDTEIAAREYGSIAVSASATTNTAGDIYQHLIRRGESQILIGINGSISFLIGNSPFTLPFANRYEYQVPHTNYGEGQYWSNLIEQVPVQLKQPTAHMLIDGIQLLDANTAQIDCSLYGINPFSSEITLEKVGCDFYYTIDPDYTGGGEWLHLGYNEKQMDMNISVRYPNQTYSPINVIFTIQLDETEGTSLVQQLYSLEEDNRYLHIRLGGEGILWFSGFEPVPFYPYVSSDYVH